MTRATRCATTAIAWLVLVACRRAPPEREEPVAVPVRCVPARRESVEVTRVFRGRIAAPPGGDQPIAAQVAGRVVDVFVHEGDRVAASTVVATIDDSATRDALRQADAARAQAEAAAANADATLERTRQLVARGIAAKQELDDAVARAEQGKAAVSAAAASADLARRTLGRVQVRSTFDGVVTRVWRGPGALVDGTATTPIAQLAASSRSELVADATERQLLDVAEGQPARIQLTAGGDAIAGTVRARSTALDPATGLGSVRVALSPTTPVVFGAFGKATVSLGVRRDVLVVPAAAMRGAVADGAELAVCKGGAAELRSVQTGYRDVDRIEIVAGVREGERVAVDHVLGLRSGSPILEDDADRDGGHSASPGPP